MRLSFSYRRITFLVPSPKHSHLITVSLLGTVINLGFMIPSLEHQFSNITYHEPGTMASTLFIMSILWMSTLSQP